LGTSFWDGMIYTLEGANHITYNEGKRAKWDLGHMEFMMTQT